MELLPVETILQKSKMRRQTEGVVDKVEGIFRGISGCEFQGYEIHMGETRYAKRCLEDKTEIGFRDSQDQKTEIVSKDAESRSRVRKNVIQSDIYENVYGSYVHGIFDQAKIADAILHALAKKKGVALEEGGMLDYQAFKEKEYDKLADTLREYLNMEKIYGMLREADLD